MYCTNCGMELPDGSKFCSRCGKALSAPEEGTLSHNSMEVTNADVRDINVRMSESELSVDEEISHQRKTNFSRSVSFSAEQRQENRMVFEIFARLVSPVKTVEDLTSRIEENTKAFNVAVLGLKSKTRRFTAINIIAIVIEWLVRGFMILLLMQVNSSRISSEIIIFDAVGCLLIVLSIISEFVEYSASSYTKVDGNITWGGDGTSRDNTEAFRKIEAITSLKIKSVRLFVLSVFSKACTIAMIVFLYVTCISDPSYNDGNLIVLPSICLAILFFDIFLKASRVNEFEKIKGAYRQVADNARNNDIYFEDRAKVVSVIAPYICFVPKEYRSSSALSRLVSLYDSSKADNLKEALHLYDTEKHNEQSLELLKIIADNTAAMAGRMGEMESRLDQMESDLSFL